MHSHMVTSYLFLGGPIALYGLVHFLNTTGPSLTKVVYAYFDRISYAAFFYIFSRVFCSVFQTLEISNVHVEFQNMHSESSSRPWQLRML